MPAGAMAPKQLSLYVACVRKSPGVSSGEGDISPPGMFKREKKEGDTSKNSPPEKLSAVTSWCSQGQSESVYMMWGCVFRKEKCPTTATRISTEGC